MVLIDLTGDTFGRLTVEHLLKRRGPAKQPRWLCRCACGTRDVVVYGERLRSGKTQSCGCLQRELRDGLRWQIQRQ